MLDRIIVVIVLLAFAGFAGIMVGYVREPDLTVVVAMMVALALHDFWISVLRPGAKQPGTSTGLEEQPTGVSGKPISPKADHTS